MTRRRASKTIPAIWTVWLLGLECQIYQITISHTEEADHLELDLAERGNHNTDNNESHIAESLQVGRSDSESPGGQKGRNSVGGLKKHGISLESNLEFESGRRSD